MSILLSFYTVFRLIAIDRIDVSKVDPILRWNACTIRTFILHAVSLMTDMKKGCKIYEKISVKR